MSQDSFTVGGEKLKYPGDPAGSAWNVINCRCTTLPVIEDEVGAGEQGVDADGESWRGTMTDREKEAIDIYQGSKYRVDNAVLRRGQNVNFEPPYSWDEADAARIDTITDALNKASTSQDYTVYRGFSGTRTGDAIGQLKRGDTLSDFGFVSTSTNQEYAIKEFTGQGDVGLAKIKVPQGSKAGYLTKPGETAPEWELLIQRGAKFEVEGFETIGNKRVVNLRLLDTKPSAFWRTYDDWEDAAFD